MPEGIQKVNYTPAIWPCSQRIVSTKFKYLKMLRGIAKIARSQGQPGALID